MTASARSIKGRKHQLFGEINITPLTDIFLVLLIIMMVVAPMMQQAKQDIKPPQMANGKPVDQGKLTVEISKEGAFYIDGQEAPVEKLKTTFEERLVSTPDKNVVIRADKTARSGAVLKVFDAARDAGYEKVTIAGESLSEQRQQELQNSVPQATEETP